MTDHDTEHKGIIMTITEDTDMDPKPYTLTAISIGLEGAATGMAVGRARMRKTECREFVVDGCHNLIIAGDD